MRNGLHRGSLSLCGHFQELDHGKPSLRTLTERWGLWGEFMEWLLLCFSPLVGDQSVQGRVSDWAGIWFRWGCCPVHRIRILEEDLQTWSRGILIIRQVCHTPTWRVDSVSLLTEHRGPSAWAHWDTSPGPCFLGKLWRGDSGVYYGNTSV